MERNRLATIINTSNQANLCSAIKTDLSQFNFIVMIGLEYLDEGCKKGNKTPVSVRINKSGELEISGLDEDIINDKNKVRIYSDKKVTHSKK